MELLVPAGTVLAVILFFGSAWTIGTLKERKARKAFFATEQSTVAQAKEGMARLVGTVVAKKTTHSPISEREVIGYRLELETNPDGSPQEKIHRKLTVVEDFYLEDESGRASIKGGASCELMLPVHGGAFELHKPSEELIRQIDLSGGDANEIFRQAQIFAQESLLCAGDRVMVRGQVTRPISPDGIDPAGVSVSGFRQAPRAVVVEAPADGPLTIHEPS